MKTTVMAKSETVDRKWYVVDATNIPLGRVASQVAAVLRGKNKPIYTPHVDTGDYVIVINTDKMVLTGNKATQKMYYRHSGFPGGLKETSYKELMEKKSDFALEKAVKGMLPKNSLGKKMFMKLKVYKGAEHPHQAQQPVELKIKGVRI
ncbi:MAG: 50S ribosomal protein L13 [Clostridiales bacterium]|nr:50S ribosomal protein L13 [Clostridiales bacterium]